MKVALVAAAVALSAGCGGGGSRPASPVSPPSAGEAAKIKAGVSSTVKAEERAYNARHWRALWNLRTPRIHSKCSYAKTVAVARRIRARTGTMKTTRLRIVVVSASRALADYILVTQSHQRIHTSGDVFTKVGSRWLDDFDGADAFCGY